MKLRKIIFISLALLLVGSGVADAQRKYKDIFDMIRGQVPGVQVGQSGPGQTPNIVIRGIGTNSEFTQPLFVVDGVITSDISYIVPENVASIDIIKDGTASIYGAQGANGVILVTTKTAQEEAMAAAAARKAAKRAAKDAKKKK